MLEMHKKVDTFNWYDHLGDNRETEDNSLGKIRNIYLFVCL